MIFVQLQGRQKKVRGLSRKKEILTKLKSQDVFRHGCFPKSIMQKAIRIETEGQIHPELGRRTSPSGLLLNQNQF
jgi:hypothetical protein